MCFRTGHLPPRFLLLALAMMMLFSASRSSAEGDALLIWKDGAGTLHLTDDPEKVPEAAREELIDPGVELTESWEGQLERKLPIPDDGQMPFEILRTPHFEVFWERGLEEDDSAGVTIGGSGAPKLLAGLLEEAGVEVQRRMGLRPEAKVEVLLYRRESYRARYGAKFPFRTAGFYDGRIHVAADALASARLRRLIRHEYSHALFREQVGSDRPFWLNEGMAELAGRSARDITDAEREALRALIAQGAWIPLRELAGGFSRLDPERVKGAYLESAAAVAWIEARRTPRQRGEMLEGLGTPLELDAVLSQHLSLEIDGVDAAVRSALVGSGDPAAAEEAN